MHPRCSRPIALVVGGYPKVLVKLADKDPSKPSAHLTVQISPLTTCKGLALMAVDDRPIRLTLGT